MSDMPDANERRPSCFLTRNRPHQLPVFSNAMLHGNLQHGMVGVDCHLFESEVFEMYGVVLWCDRQDSKAVIWCEDHGDLGYFSGSMTRDRLGFEIGPGDFVEFKFNEVGKVRWIEEMRLIAERQFVGIAETLRPVADQCSIEPEADDASADSRQQVVDFTAPKGRSNVA